MKKIMLMAFLIITLCACSGGEKKASESPAPSKSTQAAASAAPSEKVKPTENPDIWKEEMNPIDLRSTFKEICPSDFTVADGYPTVGAFDDESIKTLILTELMIHPDKVKELQKLTEDDSEDGKKFFDIAFGYSKSEFELTYTSSSFDDNFINFSFDGICKKDFDIENVVPDWDPDDPTSISIEKGEFISAECYIVGNRVYFVLGIIGEESDIGEDIYADEKDDLESAVISVSVDFKYMVDDNPAKYIADGEATDSTSLPTASILEQIIPDGYTLDTASVDGFDLARGINDDYYAYIDLVEVSISPDMLAEFKAAGEDDDGYYAVNAIFDADHVLEIETAEIASYDPLELHVSGICAASFNFQVGPSTFAEPLSMPVSEGSYIEYSFYCIDDHLYLAGGFIETDEEDIIIEFSEDVKDLIWGFDTWLWDNEA